MLYTVLFVSWLLLLSNSCRHVERGTPAAVLEAIEDVRKEHCPDRRLAVFDIEVQKRGFNLMLRGEVGSQEAKDDLVARVKEAAPDYKVEHEILVLPDPALGSRNYGLVRVSVANLRAAPRHSAELVNQVLMGTTLRLLKQQNSWFYAQAEDDYLGWINAGAMARVSDAGVRSWQESDRVLVTVPGTVVRTHPEPKAVPLTDAVLLDQFRFVEEHGRWLQVATPDDRRGFVARDAVMRYADYKASRSTTPEAILATAMQLVGRPYLWGGTSTKGFDCSGLTQTVFRYHGIPLLRDASQQARLGVAIEPGANFENLRPGDLLFFGPARDRITHVGLYIGDQRFIHAGAENSAVAINSFNPADSLYSRYRRSTFRLARRMMD